MNRKERRAEKKRAERGGQGLSPTLQAVFAAAVQHHQAGRLNQAEPLYRQVLAINPRHADSLHLLGVAAHQTGRHDLAADWIDRALAIDPTVALYRTNLGNVLKALGRLDQAIACYETAIDLDPNGADAYNNLGAALQAQGRLDEAAASLRQAIDRAPDFPEAHDNLGNVLLQQGRAEEALVCYQKAIALNPHDPPAYNNLGAAFRDMGALGEAAGCFKRAIALNPNFPQAHNNLSLILKGQGQWRAAIASCRKAIDLAPDFPEAHDNLGALLADQGRLDAAAASFRKAIDLRPGYAEAHNNLGVVVKQQGRLDGAVDCFRKAVARRSDFANAHHNLAMALLARGDLAEGWREYEWRWRTPRWAPFQRRFEQPQWRGEPAEGRTLLIHAEQGLGDSLQFCRYAVLAADRGLKVVMEVQAPLVRLLRDLAGVDQVVARGEATPAFDLHCPMLSLPLALGTTLATIPGAAGYLAADAEGAAAWRARLDGPGRRGLRVGLAWAGNPATASDPQRSLPPERLAPLLDRPEVQVFSLQKHGVRAPEDFRLIDHMDEMDDFADTASLIANLDLVISVDTAVVHLAAALGKPVWMLDRFDPDWRWLVGRRDSPWYRSLLIYRQPSPGDWGPVLAEVVQDLRRFAGEPGRSPLVGVADAGLDEGRGLDAEELDAGSGGEGEHGVGADLA